MVVVSGRTNVGASGIVVVEGSVVVETGVVAEVVDVGLDVVVWPGTVV